ncbi:MAG: hypothetical protein SV765_17945 [Pseudomonadota bacterium]|nr:hypothetical protein [Pseudomonadales bacterium]MDY6922085.1 hypothetical protein [Pseudomonadota bacterium]|tara:strand:+ start:288 stop:506 length:219 start_codon:yes stop_codon:yes gene_type:complete
MNFNMSIEDNFASFIDESSGVAVFVDSFDNHEFEVRIGTIEDSKSVGVIHATTSEELNKKLDHLFQVHQGGR